MLVLPLLRYTVLHSALHLYIHQVCCFTYSNSWKFATLWFIHSQWLIIAQSPSVIGVACWSPTPDIGLLWLARRVRLTQKRQKVISVCLSSLCLKSLFWSVLLEKKRCLGLGQNIFMQSLFFHEIQTLAGCGRPTVDKVYKHYIL